MAASLRVVFISQLRTMGKGQSFNSRDKTYKNAVVSYEYGRWTEL